MSLKTKGQVADGRWYVVGGAESRVAQTCFLGLRLFIQQTADVQIRSTLLPLFCEGRTRL